MDYLSIAYDYFKLGLSVIPIGEKKMPIGLWKENQTMTKEPDNRFKSCEAIGLVMGGETYLQAIDIDCKYDLTGNLFNQYKNEIASCEKELLKKMVVQKTKNGGYHFIFKCSEIGGNKKLANRYSTDDERKEPKKENEKVKVLIETREQGGYIVVAPSEGYEVIYGSVAEINEITPRERQILFDCAYLLNEVKDQYNDTHKVKKQVQDISPFEDFNENGDIVSFLESNGWSVVRQMPSKVLLLRPGGDGKWSADYDYNKKLLYVFSTSTEFENDKAYNHSQVMAFIKFNKDYSECAKYLISCGYGTKIEVRPEVKKQELSISELDEILNNAYIDTSISIPRPPTILSIREPQGTQFITRRLFTLCNFSCVIGKAKTKKTFLLTMLTAAIMKKDDGGKLYGELPDKKPMILYFDTEQGSYDSQVCIRRIEKMSGKNKNFRAYNLRPYEPIKRCQIIEYALKKWGDLVSFVVIDGIADLATGINDELEATRVSSLLLKWTAIYNCHITLVIHQNKGDGFATGHLGSSIMKKSEMIISVTKLEDKASSEVKCDMARGTAEFEDFIMTINNDGIPEVSDKIYSKKKKSFYDDEKEDEFVPEVVITKEYSTFETGNIFSPENQQEPPF